MTLEMLGFGHSGFWLKSKLRRPFSEHNGGYSDLAAATYCDTQQNIIFDCYAYFCSNECHYDKCHNAEHHGAGPNVIKLFTSVIYEFLN